MSNRMLSGMLTVIPMRSESMQAVAFYKLLCGFQRAGERNVSTIKTIQREEDTQGADRMGFLNDLRLTC